MPRIDEKRVFAHLFRYPIRKQVEICIRNNVGCLLTLRTSTLTSLDQEHIDFLLEASKKIPIAIHGPFHDMFPGSIDPYIREATIRRFSEAIEIAKKIGAKFLTIHLNYIETLHGRYLEEWVTNSADTFRRLTEFGIPIHIENTREKDPYIFHRILTEVGNPLVRMCLDIGHIVAYSDRSIKEWIRTLSGYISELHLHECRPGRDSHDVLGCGYIDWELVFGALRQNRVDISTVFLTLEPKDEDDLKRDILFLEEILGHDE